MKRLMFLLVVVALISGCATKEGIRLPTSGPTKENIEDFNSRNAATPAAAASSPLRDVVKTALVPDIEGPRLIVIGSVMALTLFDEPTLNKRYDVYLKQLSAASKEPGFTREWYLATSAGETAVKFSGVTGIYTRFYKAEIPKDLIRGIGFASAFGTFMAGTSGDLVAAERTQKQGTWVTRHLCSEKDINSSVCEAQYQRGLYQAVDGREIDDKLQPKEDGATIDTVTYRKR